MHILLADDSPDIRTIFQFAFGLQGHETRLADNGQEAVQAFQEVAASFDVIVLDIEMPVLDGLGALERIRQLPQGKDIPIIMFTGYNAFLYDQKAKDAGANLLVNKPIAPDELLRLMGWFVGRA
jgi:CheY-like chemotaxis protein